MIPFTIGKKSDGTTVCGDLCLQPNLFISYQTHQEFVDFTTDVLSHKLIEINKCLIIAKHNYASNSSFKQENYSYKNPENGTIKNINQLFVSPYKAFKKAHNKNASIWNTLIIKDDIWQIVPKLKKSNATQFKLLLNNGHTKNNYFIIGSSLPYRNLLLQLMTERSKDNHNGVLNQLGAEIIFNPDGLIFFRERNNINFSTYYP